MLNSVLLTFETNTQHQSLDNRINNLKKIS